MRRSQLIPAMMLAAAGCPVAEWRGDHSPDTVRSGGLTGIH
jgi:hypothetical protein